MSTQTRHDFQPCVAGAFDGGLARTTFFDGMVLTEGDMVREQSYWRGKRKLSNRALGQGVVWGLAVQWDSGARRFCISPGYGLSCCGDDLVVACDQVVAESELIDRCSEDFRRLLAAALGPRGLCDHEARPEGPIDACLLLEYVECAEGLRAADEDGCACGDLAGCRFGAVRETTRLRLVPPPPAQPQRAFGEFCARVDALREALKDTPGAVVEPLHWGAKPSVRLSLAWLDAAGNTLATKGDSLALQTSAPAQLTLTAASGASSLRLGLEPAPGQVFTSLVVDGVARSSAEALMGAFRTLSPPPAAGAAAIDIVVKAKLAPLFGSAPGWTAVVKLRLQPATSGGSQTLTASIDSLEALPTRSDCSALLADELLLAADAECTGRTLALAALYGWFAGQLGTACHTNKPDTPLSADDQTRLLLAWTVCRLAWRGLFGIDPKLAPDAGLEKCLQQFFKAWCDGLHYKGPRCDDPVHGIVLGTLQLSAKGRVLCFDEWQHRRHVLTGPLLTHWAAQVGLAAIDQGMARLASWVCCVARTSLAALPDGAQLSDQSALQLAGGVLAMGRSYAVDDHVAGARVRAVQSLAGRDFIGRLLDMVMSRRGAIAATSQLNVWSSPDHALHLLQPLDSAAAKVDEPAAVVAKARGEALLAESGLAGAALPVSARRVLRDFVGAYAESLPLARVKARADSASFEPMVAALAASGIVSVADLVDAGPDLALAHAAPQLARDALLADARSAEKAIALVYDSAVQALASAGQVVADQARASDAADPFTRGELLDSGLLSAVNKAANTSLRNGGALSAAELHGIVAKAVAMRG